MREKQVPKSRPIKKSKLLCHAFGGGNGRLSLTPAGAAPFTPSVSGWASGAAVAVSQ